MSKLNKQQELAVKNPINKSGLVIAGAGSGKTSVLTQRMNHLVNVEGIEPYNIMGMTFTNKAAGEIKDRLVKLQTDVRGMWLGTFHSIGYKIIKKHPHIIGMPDDCYVMDTKEQKKYIKRLLSSQGYKADTDQVNDIFNAITGFKEKGKRARDTKKEHFYEFYKLYEKSIKQDGVLDFAELLLGSYEIINHYETEQYFQNRFQYVLVDEFQDTNSFQYRWLLSLTEIHKNIFVVGDFDQSIYSFRGAEPGNLFRIEEDFSPINVIKLEQNYRSEKYILDSANNIIKNNKSRHEKVLWTDNETDNLIHYKISKTDEEEVVYVSETIRNLIREGYDYKDIAILYRTNFLSQQIEKALSGYGIPFTIYGGLRFFEREEVKNAIAYLRVIHNPHDNLAFVRASTTPSKGIGDKTLDKLTEYSYENEISLYDSIEFMDDKIKARLEIFKKTIDHLRSISVNKNVLDFIDVVINHCGLIEHYEEKKEEERVENINEIWASAKYFIKENPEAEFDDFINMTTLDADFEKGKRNKIDNSVSMLTVHNSKGMEFPVVFIIGLNEKIFPHVFAKKEKDIEEERRMMYVAVTRAQEKLFITQSNQRIRFRNIQYMEPSRFIEEIPQHFIKNDK